MGTRRPVLFGSGEHGLRDCAFNSEEQRESLTLAFQEAKVVLELFRDKREESREFILSLQNRVFGQCQLQLNDQAEQMMLYFRISSSQWSQVAERRQLLFNRAFQLMLNPESVPELKFGPEDAKFLTDHQTSLCRGLRFLYQLKGRCLLPCPSQG